MVSHVDGLILYVLPRGSSFQSFLESAVTTSRGEPLNADATSPDIGFRIVLVQGLNRQIRLMAAHFGYRVKQLIRVRIGNVKLAHLKPGQWRNLTDAELRGLLPQRTEW